jgi:hypothetical protein
MNFIDRYGRYHDKPVTEENKLPSNNAYCYTATAKLLALPVDIERIQRCYFDSLSESSFNRHPYRPLPPCSRDEIQGAIILGLMNPQQMIDQKFYFCNIGDPKPASLFTKAKIFIEKIIGKHRNTIWDYPEIWDISFTLPKQDQYFILKCAGKNPGIFLTLFFYISSLLTLRKQNRSGMVILWQKLKHLNMQKSFLYKQIDEKKVIDSYFIEDHIFRRSLYV